MDINKSPATSLGITLCPYIGQDRSATYRVTALDNCRRWDFWNCPPPIQTINFTHLVGGSDCWGRCGATCQQYIDNLVYSESCHAHDHCVVSYYELAPACDALFLLYAMPDYLNISLSCEKPYYLYDFTITSMNLTGRTVTAGDAITVSVGYELRNIIPFTPAANLIKFYLSPDNYRTIPIASCDTEFHGIWGSGTCSGQINIPFGFMGNYFLVAAIAETWWDRNYLNNIWDAG